MCVVCLILHLHWLEMYLTCSASAVSCSHIPLVLTPSFGVSSANVGAENEHSTKHSEDGFPSHSRAVAGVERGSGGEEYSSRGEKERASDFDRWERSQTVLQHSVLEEPGRKSRRWLKRLVTCTAFFLCAERILCPGGDTVFIPSVLSGIYPCCKRSG